MQNSSLVCGNCGQNVAISDVTCPHCDVLLAAYASPVGSTTAHMYESSEPIADAVPQAEMYVPDPAPPVEIPDEVEVASTAPRPLFDTQLTIEEIAKAAEGGHEESLVLVSDKKIATKAKVFDTPDYARPPSDAKPVELVDGGDEEMIARAPEPSSTQPAVDTVSRSRDSGQSAGARRAAERKSREVARSGTREPKEPIEPEDTEPKTHAVAEQPSYSIQPSRWKAPVDTESGKGDDSWLYDLSQSGPTQQAARKPPRERGPRPEPTRTTTTPPAKRGSTDTYLRKLHAESGFESKQAQLSKPVDMSGSPSRATGCSFILYLTLGLLWLFTIISFVDGDLNGFLLFLAIVTTVLERQKAKIFAVMER